LPPLCSTVHHPLYKLWSIVVVPPGSPIVMGHTLGSEFRLLSDDALASRASSARGGRTNARPGRKLRSFCLCSQPRCSTAVVLPVGPRATSERPAWPVERALLVPARCRRRAPVCRSAYGGGASTSALRSTASSSVLLALRYSSCNVSRYCPRECMSILADRSAPRREPGRSSRVRIFSSPICYDDLLTLSAGVTAVLERQRGHSRVQA